MNATTSVEDCADAIVDGMERRRRRVYVPKAIALVQALRTLTTGPVGDWIIRARRRRWCRELEAEITSARPLLRRLERGDAAGAAPAEEQPEQPA